LSRTFRVSTTERPSTLVARVQEGIKKYGADFKGDTKSGSFSAKGVKGTYSIQDRGVTVTITDKPAVIPWGLVESLVRGFFDRDDGSRNIPARRARRYRRGKKTRSGRGNRAGLEEARPPPEENRPGPRPKRRR
jgi:hypothetical protein